MRVDVAFVRTGIQTGMVMVRLAHTERDLPDLEGAKQAIGNARKALASAQRFLSALKDVRESTLEELAYGIEELRSEIDRYDHP